MSFLYNLTTYNDVDIWKVLEQNDYEESPNFIIKPHNHLLIIKYRKNKLNQNNYKTLGLWRSVVLDKKRKRIVAFSPPKSIPWHQFALTNKIENSEITLFEEGTMVNLFFDQETNEWEISTKSGIGGRYKYFQESPKTFRYMFLEVMNHTGLEFDMLNKLFCYSFVFQHPDNRIVVPHKKMRLILTNIYSFVIPSHMMVYEQPLSIYHKMEESREMDIIGDIITPLKKLNNTEYTSSWPKLFEKYQRMDMEYTNVGIQVYNKYTGYRTKLRNPSYEQVKFLKGNSPKLQFQYYNLRQADKVKEFLKYYPEYKQEFARLRLEMHKWTQQLFINYQECYVKKYKPLKDFAYQFRPHMYQLHKLYLNEFRTVGYYVSKQEVIKYVNSLHPAKLMYAINYAHRKNTIDIISNDTKIVEEQKVINYGKK